MKINIYLLNRFQIKTNNWMNYRTNIWPNHINDVDNTVWHDQQMLDNTVRPEQYMLDNTARHEHMNEVDNFI